MPARRVTTVTMPVDRPVRGGVRVLPRPDPAADHRAARPGLLVTLTLPEHLDAGHVRFARDLAATAARYAAEVERPGAACPRSPPRGDACVMIRVAPAGVASTGRGLPSSLPEHHSGRNPPS